MRVASIVWASFVLLGSSSAWAGHKNCEILEKITGGAAANYKFKVTEFDDKTFQLCVKGQTINSQAAIGKCKSGEYDDIRVDCAHWP
jgi:hypothetical protein